MTAEPTKGERIRLRDVSALILAIAALVTALGGEKLIDRLFPPAPAFTEASVPSLLGRGSVLERMETIVASPEPTR